MSNQQGSTAAANQFHTFAEAADRYLAVLPAMKLKDERNRRRQVVWWQRAIGHIPLAELTPSKISAARDRLESMPVPPKVGSKAGAAKRRQPATVVRYLAALSHVLTVAVEDWGWLSENPVRNVRKPRQPPGRVRFLSSDELPRLLEACDQSTSSCLALVVLIALATGMRRGEILGLRWTDVDLEHGVLRLEDTKNNERRQVPLLGRALDLLRVRAQPPHQPDDRVFPGEIAGRPCDITKAWNTAVARAVLSDFRFHDLRHTTASYLAMRGASLLEIGVVLGQKSTQMTKRYAHLHLDHTRSVLGRMVTDVLPSLPAAEDATPTAVN